MEYKYKITLVLTCLLFIPSITGAYYSAEQFRTDIMNSIREDKKRQQIQDILNDGDRAYKGYFDTYYREVDNLQAEHDFKLKQLGAEIDARERAEAWEKEKAVLGKELELIIKENELKKREDVISKPVSSDIDWDQAIKEAKEASEAVEKSHKLETPENKTVVQPKLTPTEKKSIFNNFDTKKGVTVTPTTTEPMTTPTITPTPKKNIFRNIFNKFIGLFK